MLNLARAIARFLVLLFLLLKYGIACVFSPRKASAGLYLRLFFQDAGGAVLKLGQIAAMRVDFLPEKHTKELLKLLDEVPPFDSVVAREIVQQELHGSIAELFETFEDKPVAAASFGQVHSATLSSGQAVVVKVQRPGICNVVNADLTLFRLGAFFIDALGVSGRNPVKPIFEDFRDWTKEELDYRIEGSHNQELHDKAVGSKTERIPQVHWSHTSARVLTLERLEGLWVKEILQGLATDKERTLQELAKRHTSLTQVSQTLLRNTLRQIFVYGIYHVDLHAGNLIIMTDGAIGYVDFGITGRITERAKETQVKIHLALESGDADEFYRAVAATTSVPYLADTEKFEKAVKRGYETWLTAQSMGAINVPKKSFARLMLKINEAARRSGISFRTMEVRIFRTLATMDAVLLQFAPTLDVRSEFRHFFAAYRINQLFTRGLPGIIHKLPSVLEMISDHLEETEVVETAFISTIRRVASIVSYLIGFVVILCGIVALVIPRLAHLLETEVHMPFKRIGILALIIALFFAWLGRILKLRSVVRGSVVKRKETADSLKQEMKEQSSSQL